MNSHPKIGLYTNFHENQEQTLTEFWLIQAKIKMKINNLRKTVRYLNSPPWNYIINFHEDLRKKMFDSSFTDFLLIEAKLKMIKKTFKKHIRLLKSSPQNRVKY